MIDKQQVSFRHSAGTPQGILQDLERLLQQEHYDRIHVSLRLLSATAQLCG